MGPMLFIESETPNLGTHFFGSSQGFRCWRRFYLQVPQDSWTQKATVQGLGFRVQRQGKQRPFTQTPYLKLPEPQTLTWNSQGPYRNVGFGRLRSTLNSKFALLRSAVRLSGPSADEIPGKPQGFRGSSKGAQHLAGIQLNLIAGSWDLGRTMSLGLWYVF